MNEPEHGVTSTPTNNVPAFADEAVFRAFAEERSWEPGWLAEYRRDAWKRYRRQNQPKGKDERWRFSPRARLSLSSFQLSNDTDAGEATTLDVNGQDLSALGVIFGPLDQVLLNQPAALEDLADFSGPGLGAESAQLLTHAYAGHGIVLRVPKNVTLTRPIFARYFAPAHGEIRFQRTLLILEEGASATLVESFESQSETDVSVVCSTASVLAKGNARAERILAQNLNLSSSFYQLDSNRAERNAGVRSLSLHLGSAQSRFENLAVVAGEGAEVELLGVTAGEKEQLFDQRTRQLHLAPHGRSDLLYKNALMDEAKSIFSGLIKVEEPAQQTDAYQTNRNLLLSPKAEADSLPGLEILANEVKCSHGATTGEIDSDQLFYLLSRGIPKATAEQLLVFGFLREVLQRIGDDSVTEFLHGPLEDKFARR